MIKKMRSFKDLRLASMMSRRGQSLRFVVEREGLPEPLEFSIVPEMNEDDGLRYIGIQPARSTTLFVGETQEDRELMRDLLDDFGWPEVEPGMTLVRVFDLRSHS